MFVFRSFLIISQNHYEVTHPMFVFYEFSIISHKRPEVTYHMSTVKDFPYISHMQTEVTDSMSVSYDFSTISRRQWEVTNPMCVVCEISTLSHKQSDWVTEVANPTDALRDFSIVSHKQTKVTNPSFSTISWLFRISLRLNERLSLSRRLQSSGTTACVPSEALQLLFEVSFASLETHIDLTLQCMWCFAMSSDHIGRVIGVAFRAAQLTVQSALECSFTRPVFWMLRGYHS